MFSGRQRLALLLGVALLVVLRLPQAWAQGRFLDEEGTIFLGFAWHRPALQALFRSFAGYLNLGANATTLATARLVRAQIVPLELAPYVTMVTALLFQLLPALLLLSGRGGWLANRWAVLAALLMLAIGPMTEEVFVNTLHIQFHLALCSALILALDLPRRNAARAAYLAILFLTPLCGPVAVVLLPLFALRSLLERDPARRVQTLALAAGAAVQLLVFFTPSPVRGHFQDPATLSAILFIRLVVMPFLSPALANAVGQGTYASYHAAGAAWWFAAVAGTVYCFALLALALRDRRDAAGWLIVAGLGYAVASFGIGMIASDPSEWFSVGAGQRYNFLPLTLLSWGLVALAMRPGPHRRACVALCALTLVWGAVFYPHPLVELSRGPAWAPQIAAWRGDHDRALVAWTEHWPVDLSDRDRPCSPPKQPGAAKTDPNYCESVWVAWVLHHVPPSVTTPR